VALWTLLPACLHIPQHSQELSWQEDFPSLHMAKVFSRCSTATKTPIWDGGGDFIFYPDKHSPLPNLALDWVYKKYRLHLQVSNPVGAVVIELKASKHKAHFSGKLTSLSKQKNITLKDNYHNTLDDDEILALSSMSLGITAQEFACFLKEGLPQEWKYHTTYYKAKPSKEVLYLKHKGRHITIAHIPQSQNTCTKIAWKEYLGLHRPHIRICFLNNRHKNKTPRHSFATSYGWAFHWIPEENI